MGRLERHCNCLQLQGGHVEEEARVIGCKLQEGRIWQDLKEFLITVSSQCRTDLRVSSSGDARGRQLARGLFIHSASIYWVPAQCQASSGFQDPAMSRAFWRNEHQRCNFEIPSTLKITLGLCQLVGTGVLMN